MKESSTNILDESTKLKVENLSSLIVVNADNLSKQRIDTSPFDKTMLGTVVDKKTVERINDPEEGTKVKRTQWTVACNGVQYKIWETDCDITSVGQKVRVYNPNNKGTKLYAEVIDNTKRTFLLRHPSTCTYNWQTHKITETWLLADGTQDTEEYQLYIRTDQTTGEEEVYKMELPDGTTIDLNGFFIDRFS